MVVKVNVRVDRMQSRCSFCDVCGDDCGSMAGLQRHANKNKNRNHSINYAKILGYER